MGPQSLNSVSLITFANSLDPDQVRQNLGTDRQNVGPDLQGPS